RCRPDRPECRVPSRCPAAEPASFTARLDRRGPAAGAASLFIGEPDLASPIDSPMDVTINERSPVDFELDIRATHDELEPRLHEALKEQRKKMNLKGFRPGRVPMSLAKKMYGEAIAAQIAEEVLGEAYRDEVADDESREVLGQPRLVELDSGYGGDLHAVVRFGVKPAFEIADLSGTTVNR